MTLTANMGLHVPLNLAPLREPGRVRVAARTIVPAAAESLSTLLGVFDVGFRGVLEQVFGIGKDQTTNIGPALVAPETPVLVVFVAFIFVVDGAGL